MTSPESPSSLLERAADLIENLACGAPAPEFWPLEVRGSDMSKGGGAWMAVMSPSVATPLVAWLREMSAFDSDTYAPKGWTNALKLARTVLKEA